MLSKIDGQTMTEYAVTLGVITLAIVLTFAALSGAFVAKLGSVVSYL